MSIPQITTVEGIAHLETEATVQAKVDQDPTVDPDINTETIVLTGTTDNDHMKKIQFKHQKQTEPTL